MQLSPETRSILRQYKTLINERRHESGLSPVTTAKVLDEICESATRQCAVYLCGHFILQGGQGCTVNNPGGAYEPPVRARKPCHPFGLTDGKASACGAAPPALM